MQIFGLYIGRVFISRKSMKCLLAAILCLLVPTCAFASDNSYKVIYDGGSLPSIKAGTGVKLYIDPAQIRIERDKTDLVTDG